MCVYNLLSQKGYISHDFQGACRLTAKEPTGRHHPHKEAHRRIYISAEQPLRRNQGIFYYRFGLLHRQSSFPVSCSYCLRLISAQHNTECVSLQDLHHSLRYPVNLLSYDYYHKAPRHLHHDERAGIASSAYFSSPAPYVNDFHRKELYFQKYPKDDYTFQARKNEVPVPLHLDQHPNLVVEMRSPFEQHKSVYNHPATHIYPSYLS